MKRILVAIFLLISAPLSSEGGWLDDCCTATASFARSVCNVVKETMYRAQEGARTRATECGVNPDTMGKDPDTIPTWQQFAWGVGKVGVAGILAYVAGDWVNLFVGTAPGVFAGVYTFASLLGHNGPLSMVTPLLNNALSGKRRTAFGLLSVAGTGAGVLLLPGYIATGVINTPKECLEDDHPRQLAYYFVGVLFMLEGGKELARFFSTDAKTTLEKLGSVSARLSHVWFFFQLLRGWNGVLRKCDPDAIDTPNPFVDPQGYRSVLEKNTLIAFAGASIAFLVLDPLLARQGKKAGGYAL